MPSHRLDTQDLVERLAAIVNSATDVIISTDAHGVVETWNHAATRMFRYTPEEILDQSLLLIIPPTLHQEEKQRFDRLRQGEQVGAYESQLLARGGDKKNVSATMTAIRNSAGDVVGAVLVLRDHELHQHEDIERARLAAIVESSDDAIIAKDLNGVITSWNLAAERMFGYTTDEIIGRSVLTIIPPDLQHEEPAILAQIRAGHRIEHLETQRLHKSGNRVEVSLTSSPICDPVGNVIGASKIVRDISTRRQSDDARLRLAAIVESSDDAIISKNLDSIITSWNAGAERMFGYTSEEIVGQSVMRLMPRDLYHEEPHIIGRLRSGQRIQHFETKRLRKNGDTFDVSLTVSPVKDDNGRVIGASKIVRDISEQKATEAALMEQEKLAAITKLLNELAHNINNPLQSLTNLVYLAAETEEGSDAKTLAKEMASDLSRLSELVRKILDLPKPGVR